MSILLKAVSGLRESKVVNDAKKKDRAAKKKADKDKKYEEYNWKELVENGHLKTLIVPNLDKYIEHHSLKHLRRKNKQQKVEGIRQHYIRKEVQKPLVSTPAKKKVASDAKTSDVFSDSSNDEVGEEYDDSSDDEVLIDLNPVTGKEKHNFSDDLFIDVNPVPGIAINLQPRDPFYESVSGDSDDNMDCDDTDGSVNNEESEMESGESSASFEDPDDFRTDRYGREVGSVPKSHLS